MNHSSNFRTFLILLVCLGGATSSATDQSESERRFPIERDMQGVDYLFNPDDDRLSLESALGDRLSPMDEFNDASSKDVMREKKHSKNRRGPKVWDQWGKWSACSVTCGIGKIVRWRHCVAGGCAPGEKEAQIKSCTLPAC